MVLAGASGAPIAAARRSATPAIAHAADRPLAFEENKGQSDAAIKFTSRTRTYSLSLTDRAAMLGLADSSQVLRMEFLGAAPLTTVVGEDQQRATTYYARSGGQPLVAAPRFARTRYSGLYRGIDAVFHGNDGQVQFDFEVAPGADPGAIRLAFAGADRVAAAKTGELLITIGGQVLRLKRPVLYQEVAGKRRSVRGGYVLVDDRTVGFHTGGYDRSIPLVIDPTIAYSTYLGSPADERIIAVEANAAGEAYVFGATMDRLNFPATTPGVGRLSGASEYCFVSKFNANGTDLLYSVVFQDTAQLFGTTYCDAMTLAPSGEINVLYQSIDGAFVKTLRRISEAPFGGVTSSTMLLTALEGFLPAPAVKVDAAGNVYAIGGCFNTRVQTPSPYPFPNGFRVNPGPGKCDSLDEFYSIGPSESVLIKVDAAGVLRYGTFLGGASDDHTAAAALAIDGDGGAYVGGATSSSEASFPVTSDAFQPFCSRDGPASPCRDAFFSRINTNSFAGSSLVYSTFLGGSEQDAISAIAVSPGNVVTVAGETESPNFPGTAGPLDGTAGGVFLSRFDLNATEAGRFVFSSLLPTQLAFAGLPPQLRLLPHGKVAVAGTWGAADFSSVDELPVGDRTTTDPLPFLTILAGDGKTPALSSLLSGGGSADPRIAAAADGSLFVGLTSGEANRAGSGAYQFDRAGGKDILLFRVANAIAENQPPVISNLFPILQNATSVSGAAVSIFAAVSDPDGDPVTVTISGPQGSEALPNNPSGFYGASLNFPLGTSTVTVTAVDSLGGTASATTQVTVRGVASTETGTITVRPVPTLDGGYDLQPGFIPDVSVRIENVTGPGVTTLNIRTNIAFPPLPAGYQLGSPPYYYDVASTVPASGPYTVCVDLTGMSFADSGHLRMYFHDGTAWTNATAPTIGALLCGQAPRTGTFAIAHPGAASNVATTIAGTGHFPNSLDGPGGDPRDDVIEGGSATGSAFGLGQGGIALDRARGLLYATTYASVRRVDLNTGTVRTIAGDGVLGDFVLDPVDGTPGIPGASGVDARSTHVTNPNQLAIDGDGNLFIAEYCQVRRVDRLTNIITTVAGDGFCRSRGDGGPATQASLMGSFAMVRDAAGNMLIGEVPGRIRRVDATTGIITTVAGDGTATLVPGPATATGWPATYRLALAPGGDLYLAIGNGMVVRLSAGSNGTVDGDPAERISIVNTCAGQAGGCPALKFGGDGGPISQASFNAIYAMDVEANGDLLIADSGDYRIRRVSAGADHVVTGLNSDEIVTTVAGYNPTFLFQGVPGGAGFYLQGEDYGLSSATYSMFEVLADPRGGFFYVNASLDYVRHIGSDAPAASADLSVTASSTSPRAALNGGAVYFFSVDNAGPSDAVNGRLTIPIPPTAESVGMSQGGAALQASCTLPSANTPGGTITCDLGTVAAGMHMPFSLTLRANASGVLPVTFSVSSDTSDPATGNNSTTVNVAVNHPPVPNPGPSQSVLATSASGALVHLAGGGSDQEGDPLTFSWSNGGTPLGTGASIDVTLPAGLNIVTLTAFDGRNSGSADVEIEVLPSGDLSIPQIAAPSLVHIGEPFTFGVTVANAGPFGAQVARLRYVLPAGLTYVSGAPSCSELGGIVVCDTDGLAAGSSVLIPIVVRAGTLGTIQSLFSVSNSSGDPNPANDTRTVSTDTDLFVEETIHVTDEFTVPEVMINETITVVDTVEDTFPPAVTPPANITLAATEFTGAKGAASPALHAFLIGGTATDNSGIAPTRLTPQLSIGGSTVDIDDQTLFVLGTNVVLFRFVDAAGNVGTAAATVTVTTFIGTLLDRGGVEYALRDSGGNPQPVTIAFDNLPQPVFATANVMPNPPPLPQAFELVGQVYDISTAPAAAGPITVRLPGPGTAPGYELVHFEGSAWVIRTQPDCSSGTTVCGRVSSLSPFAVVKVTVADTKAPVVTPPAAVTLPATEAAGARPSASFALSLFLAGGSATDLVDPAPVRLTPQVSGADVTGSTLFPIGQTTVVTFRYRDASGNVGVATSRVTVVAGSPRIAARVAGTGSLGGTKRFVDVEFSNTGDGNARQVNVDLVVVLPVKGIGIPRLVSPDLPIKIGDLNAGGRTVVRIVISVPAGVKEMLLSELGTFRDIKGKVGIFIEAQTIR